MIIEGQPSHIEQVKRVNLGIVYQHIDQLGPISRIELSKRTRLAPASITKIVRELMDAHLIQETLCEEPLSRGRPAIGLTTLTTDWHYLSLRILPHSIWIGLRELNNTLIVEEQLPIQACDTPQQLLSQWLALTETFFVRHQNKLQRLTAIAITLSGIINPKDGVVHAMPMFSNTDLPLKSAFHQLTGLPIFVKNEVCAATLAESFFGAAQGCQEIIQVVIDHHVGAGIISGGKLLHNGKKNSVEIGHTQVDPYGKTCYCGHVGCLETVAGIDGILALAAERLAQGVSSLLTADNLSAESLCAAAIRGDQLAKDLIIQVGQSVGRIVATMVNIFNPEKIILASPFNQAASILHPALFAVLQQQALPAYIVNLRLESAQLSEEKTLSGAALIKHALFNGELLISLLEG